MTGDADANRRGHGPRVAVVGPCASGKTTLVAGLRGRGYDAFVSGQEHSEIANLWDHLHPDVVIGLRIDLATLRSRRGDGWSASLYETQLRRLADAFAHAGIVIDTSALDVDAALARAEAFLVSRFPPVDGEPHLDQAL